jgi:hypothetical protein
MSGYAALLQRTLPLSAAAVLQPSSPSSSSALFSEPAIQAQLPWIVFNAKALSRPSSSASHSNAFTPRVALKMLAQHQYQAFREYLRNSPIVCLNIPSVAHLVYW